VVVDDIGWRAIKLEESGGFLRDRSRISGAGEVDRRRLCRMPIACNGGTACEFSGQRKGAPQKRQRRFPEKTLRKRDVNGRSGLWHSSCEDGADLPLKNPETIHPGKSLKKNEN
jgi:hypothetical protein